MTNSQKSKCCISQIKEFEIPLHLVVQVHLELPAKVNSFISESAL